jgi:hypothetical protein
MARLPVERHSFVLSLMYFVQSFPEATGFFGKRKKEKMKINFEALFSLYRLTINNF